MAESLHILDTQPQLFVVESRPYGKTLISNTWRNSS